MSARYAVHPPCKFPQEFAMSWLITKIREVRSSRKHCLPSSTMPSITTRASMRSGSSGFFNHDISINANFIPTLCANPIPVLLAMISLNWRAINSFKSKDTFPAIRDASSEALSFCLDMLPLKGWPVSGWKICRWWQALYIFGNQARERWVTVGSVCYRNISEGGEPKLTEISIITPRAKLTYSVKS